MYQRRTEQGLTDNGHRSGAMPLVDKEAEARCKFAKSMDSGNSIKFIFGFF